MATAYDTPVEATGMSLALVLALGGWSPGSEPRGLEALEVSAPCDDEPTRVLPLIIVEVERCVPCVPAEAGVIDISSLEWPSTAGDRTPESGHPGWGLRDDAIGVGVDKSCTSSLGGRFIVRAVDGVFVWP
jgi:hypothetical protein